MQAEVKTIVKIFRENANEKNALAMKKYMKGHFEYFGIMTPERKKLSKEFIKTLVLTDIDNTDDFIKDCWKQPQRELQYFALDLLVKLVKKAPENRINLYEYLLLQKSWWDTIDNISINLVGIHFQLYPRLIIPVTEKWMNSGNVWLKRACLLFQLRYKDKTDLNLLSEYLSGLIGSKEFFINKAIGWILREYSKTDPQWVMDFVDSHKLSPLSSREALKWVKKNK